MKSAIPSLIFLLTFLFGSFLRSPALGQIPLVPKLVGVTPANGAVGVSTSVVLQFTFDIEMEKTPALGGAPPFLFGGIGMEGVASNLFEYAWSADGKVLTCTPLNGLSASLKITWTLNPAAANPVLTLKSANGVALPTALYTGNFETGEGNPNGCEPGEVTRGSVSFFKQARYKQTGNTNPTLVPEDPYSVSILAAPAKGDTMLSATLGFPNGTSKPIPGFFGQFLQSDSYQTETALNAGYPAGNYQWSIELGRRVQPYTFTMSVPAQFTSVPAFTNLTNFAAANPTQDFTLEWAAFAGATANDGIYLQISEVGGQGAVVFQAPDPCIPRDLKPTDTSILIPANTLSDGKRYQISLSFTRIFANDQAALPESNIFGSVSVSTETEVAKGVQPEPPQPVLDNPTWTPAGVFTGRLRGVQGRTYLIEASSDLQGWQEIQRIPLLGSDNTDFAIQTSSFARRYFRVKESP